MFIGHLPAGYLCTSALLEAGLASRDQHRALLRLGLASSVLPDLDMLYFYLVDRQQQLHHGYWTHIPFFWLCLFGGGGVLAWLKRSRLWLAALALSGVNIALHLLLDTLVGGICWLSPASDAYLTLFEVPARYDPWLLNFLLHWTFGLELLICMAAAALYLQRRRVRMR